MKLAWVRVDGREQLGRISNDEVLPLSDVPLVELLANGEDVRGLAPRGGAATRLREEALLAPLRPRKIVAVGLNYADHARETGLAEPEVPLLFAKFSTSVIGPGEPIVLDRSLTERVDWEVELAVIVGAPMRNVPESQALESVFGYTIGNDVSARDIQQADGQWVRAKSFDTFCPLGPVVVTADEIDDPQDLFLRTRVNGEVMQDSSTSEMLFGVAELLSFCSRHFTLEPGDLLLTGTPWGVGEFMNPKRSLNPGDVVEVEVERIGTLRNPVISVSEDRAGRPAKVEGGFSGSDQT